MLKKLQKFSPKVIAAFKRARDCDEDERDEASVALHVLLKRPPWAEDVMDVDEDEPPDYIARCGEADAQNARTWTQARKLRLGLEATADVD